MKGFDNCLQFSLGERKQFDKDCLLSHIYGAVKVDKTEEEIDKTGIDYVITLRNGAEIFVDAKTREKGASKYWKYGEPEVALEDYSVVEKKITGWSLKENSNVDYILYTFDKHDTPNYYFIPFQLLRIAFAKNYHKWKTKYGVKREETKERGYHSSCVFVPASVLIDAVSEQMASQRKAE